MSVLRKTAAVSLGAVLVISAALVWVQAQSAADTDELSRLVGLLKVGEGSRVADVGAGDGDFAFALAPIVGAGGHVFATEIDDSSLSQMRRTVQREHVSNLTVVEVAEDDAKLPAGCCDAMYLRYVYHHMTKPRPTVDSLFKALKPGGRLAIIDFEPSGRGLAGVPEDRGGHGVRPTMVVSELTAAGFRELQRVPRWRGSHFLVLFERPAAP